MGNFMPNENLRIFLGYCWFGRIFPTLTTAMREKGIQVTCAVDEGLLSMYPDAECDLIIDFRGLKLWQYILKKLKYFWTFLHKHDAFIFMYGHSLLPYNIDLPILKILGKKTIMWFIGSDIRHYEPFAVAAKKAGLKHYMSKDQGQGPKGLKRKRRMIRRVEKSVSYILSNPSYSQLLTGNYYHIFTPLDVNNFTDNSSLNTTPLVVHAPTNERIKGTSYVLDAVDRLKKEGYDFEFQLCRNISNTRLREILQKADIVVDQLFATANGMFANEAMASGCAVLGGNIPEFSGRPLELPVIHTDPDNIYQNLKLLLDDPELRQELGEKGRKYVEKYHDSRKIASDILKLLSGDTEGLISYNPKG